MTEDATKTYTAKFRKASQAKSFAARIQEPGWYATDVEYHTGGVVTFTGPNTRQYFLDMAETVGYYGSPPQGPRATLDDVPTPRSY